jgi:hypothetical protein
MHPLTIFGLVSITAMLITYALERRNPWFVFAFACTCLTSSTYGFLSGAWLFGIVEVFWAGVAFHRWWKFRQIHERVQDMKKLDS